MAASQAWRAAANRLSIRVGFGTVDGDNRRRPDRFVGDCCHAWGVWLVAKGCGMRIRREFVASAWTVALVLCACSAPDGAGLRRDGGGSSLGGSTSGSGPTSGSSSASDGGSTSSGPSSGASASPSGGGSGGRSSPTDASWSASSSSDGSGNGSGGSPSSGGTSPSGSSGLDTDIAAILASVSVDQIGQSVQMLTGFGTRNSCSAQTSGTQGIVAARDWLKAKFDAIGGLKTSLYPYAQTRCAQQFTRHNVIALLPGTTHPERVVIVGGHYDSRAVDVLDGTSPAPGANDSGSQTALVLELARAFAGHAFDDTVAFIVFAGEEQGLVGSRALAGDMSSIVPAAKVVAMLQSDIVGGDNTVNDANTLRQFRLYSPGTPREVSSSAPDGTTDDTSPSRGVMRYVATWGAAYVPSMTIVPILREDRPGRGSDHEPFIDMGRPGVRFIETVESPNAGTVTSHQHSPNDLPTFVTPAYTTRIAQVVGAVAASLARAPDAPASVAVGGKAASPMLTWSMPSTGPVDHYVVAARPTAENFYHTRVRVDGVATSATVTPAALGVDGSRPYFVSVATVDGRGHESLFAYPEYRCDSSGCAVPQGALNITAKN